MASRAEHEGLYVSITGLRLKSFRFAPLFWYWAVRSFAQARSAPGNLLTEARTIDAVHHTLTVWRDRTDMVRYIRTGPHLRAMRVFPKIASGKVLGFSADASPDWPEARRLWQERGVPVRGTWHHEVRRH